MTGSGMDGLAIMPAAPSINFLGDALRDVLDMRESRGLVTGSCMDGLAIMPAAALI